ncbi:PspC domain-containing protein [Pedobacter gandavensis]|uniref:PspC domain-containing protein n=1 Tax=Pedobacter gandavensis TaxID=2679963 RepID=A0ABR6EWM1_9SPHI|nr:PspC domain-containing protein [Pedobacter gandavensis]MBB2149676.1 PspC domain-containing protein [Pedobacter gandavensis]
MKKTLNINIGNSIIHLEEDAYEMLTVYLNEVKQHFSKNADDFEIVTDIENRIAEMFGEMLSGQQKQVIDIQDVQSVIAQMGSVKDFENSEAEEEMAAHDQSLPPHDGIKKLYRDTDQAMVAGVCVGLGHYLNIEARWLRLAALISIFVGGSGLLIYLIMWIVIPRAESKSEKMAMRGEAANLRGFMNSHQNPLLKQSRGFLAEFFEFLGNFINGTGKAVLKVIATLVVIFGSFFLLMLIIGLAGVFGMWDADVYNNFPFNIIDESYFSTMLFAAFIVLLVPVLALVLFSIRVAFNVKPIHKTLSYGLLIIWLGGVAVTVFYIAKVSSEFKESAEFSQVTKLVPHQTLVLAIDKTRFFTKEDSLKYKIDPVNYRGRTILSDGRGPFDHPRDMNLRLEKSENGKMILTENYSSQGKTFETALKNAQNIHYDFQQIDSVLNFSSALQLVNKANYRGQEVSLTLSVPVGTHLKINRDFNRYLNGYNFWDCYSDDNQDYSEWVMTDTGLKCLNEHKDADSEH